MRDLRKINGIEFGSWSDHAPGHPCGYMCTSATAAKIEAALAAGERVLVGNSPRGRGRMLSKINSRFHGYTIRTIRAVQRT